MNSMGRRQSRGGDRLHFRCPRCRRYHLLGAGTPEIKPRLSRDALDLGWVLRLSREGRPVTDDDRGRWRVQLGVGHEYANSAGWQWLHRYLAMDALGRRLRPDEHVHHVDGDLSNNDPANLRVVAAEHHGRLHARGDVVAEGRQGMLAELEVPWTLGTLPRGGPVLGRSAPEWFGETAPRPVPVLRLADLGPLDVVRF